MSFDEEKKDRTTESIHNGNIYTPFEMAISNLALQISNHYMNDSYSLVEVVGPGEIQQDVTSMLAKHLGVPHYLVENGRHVRGNTKKGNLVLTMASFDDKIAYQAIQALDNFHSGNDISMSIAALAHHVDGNRYPIKPDFVGRETSKPHTIDYLAKNIVHPY